MSGIYAKYHVQIMLLFVYTTRFVIFTCRYFKLRCTTNSVGKIYIRPKLALIIKLNLVGYKAKALTKFTNSNRLNTCFIH